MQSALRVQQLQGHGGNGHCARRPLLAVPSAAVWQWAASVDLEKELLLSIGPRQIRIPQAAWANLTRTLLLPLKRIEADPLDEEAWVVFLLFPTLVLEALDRGGGAGTRNLNARCRRFESGDWETLLAEHHKREDELAEEREEREVGAQGVGEPSDAIAQERRIRRCLRLGCAGRGWGASSDAGFFAYVARCTRCPQHGAGGTRSFSMFLGFSRELSGAALSAVGSAVPGVDGVR
jgi:hypothetical protein